MTSSQTRCRFASFIISKQSTRDIKLLQWKSNNWNLGNVIFFFSQIAVKQMLFSARSDAHFKAQSLTLNLCYLRNLCNQIDMQRLSQNLHCNSISFIFSSMRVMLNFNAFICVSISYMHMDVCLAECIGFACLCIWEMQVFVSVFLTVKQ